MEAIRLVWPDATPTSPAKTISSGLARKAEVLEAAQAAEALQDKRVDDLAAEFYELAGAPFTFAQASVGTQEWHCDFVRKVIEKHPELLAERPADE